MTEYANGGTDTSVSQNTTTTTVSSVDNNQSNQGPWYSTLASGLEGEEAQGFTSYASRYQDPASFAKAVTNLRKSHDSRIPLPGPDADEKSWNEIYDKLGRPKAPTEYKFNHIAGAPPLADVEVEARENFRGVAHKLGLTQKQIDGLTQWNDTFRKTQYEAYETAPKYAAQKTMESLKSEWGPDTDMNLNLYRTAVKQYAGEDYNQFAGMRLENGTYLGDHPVIAKMFARIGRERAEDMRGTPMVNSSEMESIDNRIRQIEYDAQQKGIMTSEEPYYTELRGLYEKKLGKGNLGSSGVRWR